MLKRQRYARDWRPSCITYPPSCSNTNINRHGNKAAGSIPSSAGISRTTESQPTPRPWSPSERRSSRAGTGRFVVEVTVAGSPGDGWDASSQGGYRLFASYIPGLSAALTSEPEARAQCGRAAHWDAGGPPTFTGKGRPYRDGSTPSAGPFGHSAPGCWPPRTAVGDAAGATLLQHRTHPYRRALGVLEPIPVDRTRAT